MRYPLSVKSKSVETSGIPRDYKEALCEYVWNGFEANATTISITHTINVLGGIEEICISDNGSGICFETIQDTFGAFLASQKNALSLKIKSKVNQGKGRFAGFSFANRIKWDTVCAENGKNVQYSISVYSENKNEYEVTEKCFCLPAANPFRKQADRIHCRKLHDHIFFKALKLVYSGAYRQGALELDRYIHH